jgi:hypothetical protein
LTEAEEAGQWTRHREPIKIPTPNDLTNERSRFTFFCVGQAKGELQIANNATTRSCPVESIARNNFDFRFQIKFKSKHVDHFCSTCSSTNEQKGKYTQKSIQFQANFSGCSRTMTFVQA